MSDLAVDYSEAEKMVERNTWLCMHTDVHIPALERKYLVFLVEFLWMLFQLSLKMKGFVPQRLLSTLFAEGID